MSDLQFEEDIDTNGRTPLYQNEAARSSGLIGFLTRAGVTQRTAQYVLVGICGICILITLAMSMQIFSPRVSHPVYREDIPPSVLKSFPPDIIQGLPSKNE